ncbi:choice-of-anchor G family protein [Aeromicrobium sp. Root472D3]|uniref:choice-of-anchor G family protein n=1 Tax=Aeromicrobium sp. Root472D3 TaxID=1736540 RepID=UPI000A53EDD3|nr:choice-of-anchor G family protein [Aeromicrobium sp. Root472D3]
MNKLARNTLALGTATMIVTAAVSFSANGADATKSYSTGRFLTGSIGGTNLDSLAQLRGVTAANPGNAGANKNPLDLTVLSALPINIPGGLNLDLAKFLSASGAAGAINQYASAESTSKAIGASGAVNDSGAALTTNGGVPADAKVSLKNGPLSGINDNLASVDLGLGAVSSNTTVDKGNPSRSYKIAGANLQVGVPLIGTLVNQLSTAVAPVKAADDITLSAAQICPLVGNTLNVTTTTLLAQLDSLDLGALADLLDPILNNPAAPITGVDLCAVNPLLSGVQGLTAGLDQLIKVQVTGLDQLTTGLANFSSGGVSVDLNTGKITLDLEQILTAAGVNLNQLPPNTNLLQFITTGLISEKITSVLDKAISDLVTNLGKVDVSVTLADTALPIKLTDLTGQLVPPLVQALTQATSAVTQLGTPIDAALSQLVPSLNSLVELTANNQSQSKTPTLSTGTVNAGSISAAAVGDYYRTSALKINVLRSSLNVELAASEAATLAADVVSDQVAAADDSDAPADNGDGSDSVSDGADANADNGDDSDTVADADAQADADVTTALPSTGAPNLLPFWLLGIALLLFGGAVLLNEKRRLNQV